MRTALVTGASRGIGRAVAGSLAAQGFGLTLTSRSDADLSALAGDLRGAGASKVVWQAGDMADHSALPGIVDLHRDTFGPMSALILNAGVGTAGPIDGYRLQRYAKTVDVNLTAALVLIQSALPLLRSAARDDPDHGAKVIGLASISGVYAEPGLAVYGATKAALASLLEALNAEEPAHGVTATAIAPAYVDTDMSAWATDSIPAHTMIQTSDVVAVIDMLLGLGATTSITKVVMSRSGTSGYTA